MRAVRVSASTTSASSSVKQSRSDTAEDRTTRRCHVVVGAGSAGIILCNQLLQHDDVILIERGSDDPHSKEPTMRIPSSWPAAAIDDADISRIATLAQSMLGKRTIMYPQGTGIGGTSNINAMIWSAGHPAVFDKHWHSKWNSKSLGSCYKVVKDTVQPKQNHSSLLEHLAEVSLLGKEHSFESAAITGGHSQDADSDLIWDVNPIKSTYLCTIDSTSNERTKMRSLLFKDTLRTVDNNVTISGGLKSEEDKECGNSFRGTLTILTYCSVVSVEFENIVRTEDNSNRTEKISQNMGHNVDENSRDPSDKPYNDADVSAKASGSTFGRDENNQSSPTLTAVAVKYIDLKSNTKEVKLVKPSGGGEIILCTGVFESPRILIASGLGEWGSASNGVHDNIDSGADAVVCERGAQRVDRSKDASINRTDLTGAEGLPSSPVRLSEHTKTSATTSTSTSTRQAVFLKGIGRNLQDHTVLPIMCVGKWWNRDSTIKAVKERLQDVLTVETETETANSRDSSGSKKKERSLDPSLPDVKESSSVLSIGSVGSVLSIGSVGSIASIGCVGSVGSIGCVGSVGSIGSIASLSSIGSFASVSAVGGVGFLAVLISWLISALQCNEVNAASMWCTNWQLFYNTSTQLCSGAADNMSRYISAVKSEIPFKTALIYCTAVVLFLCVMIIVIRRRWNLESKFSYPLNCVHGYVNLDDEGNILSRDSKEAPRAQLLLVDGSLSPESLLPEIILPRYSPSASTASYLYMTYIRPSLVMLTKFIFRIPIVRAGAGYSFGFLVCNVQPYSRGRLIPVTDSSGRILDPTAPLMIEHGIFSDPRDLTVLRKAMTTARKLLLGRPIGSHDKVSTSVECSTKKAEEKKVPLPCFEMLPGFLFGNTEKEEGFSNYARCMTNTYYHACGTCAMESERDFSGRKYGRGGVGGTHRDERSIHNTHGSISNPVSPSSHHISESTEKESSVSDALNDDDVAVVDADLRVRGVLNLRVADASVFSRIPSGPISATCMAVAVALSRLMQGGTVGGMPPEVVSDMQG